MDHFLEQLVPVAPCLTLLKKKKKKKNNLSEKPSSLPTDHRPSPVSSSLDHHLQSSSQCCELPSPPIDPSDHPLPNSLCPLINCIPHPLIPEGTPCKSTSHTRQETKGAADFCLSAPPDQTGSCSPIPSTAADCQLQPPSLLLTSPVKSTDHPHWTSIPSCQGIPDPNVSRYPLLA